MRLFVAVVPPESVLDDLEAAVARTRALPGTDDRFRWTVRAQWHLTLSFLGEVAESTRADLDRRLARAARRYEPMRLAVKGAGGFSSAGRARVLWVGIDGDVTRLRDLARSAGAAARRAGVEVDEGRFRPHLTLARLREPTDVRPVVEALSSYAGPSFVASRIELVRSHLGQGEGRRSRYETVRAWPLGRLTASAE